MSTQEELEKQTQQVKQQLQGSSQQIDTRPMKEIPEDEIDIDWDQKFFEIKQSFEQNAIHMNKRFSEVERKINFIYEALRKTGHIK